MADARSLVAVFEAITSNLEQDRDDINQLDRDDHDTGDNMVANFRLVTETLQKQIGEAESADVGLALGQAAQVLRDNGRGATAPIYASGLDEAAQKLRGQSSFALEDLLPLLEGLLGGAQRAGAGQGEQAGQGSLLDVLLPAIGSYSRAKRDGQGDLEAILGALLETRRGANSTARSSSGYGRASGRDTAGEVDPGAAAAASLLEGLFGALLKGGLQSQAGGALPRGAEPGMGQMGGSAGGKYGGPTTLPDVSEADAQRLPPVDSPAQPRGSGNPIIDLLGSLFGGR
jgi:dihydroxyacetone kinase-like protein